MTRMQALRWIAMPCRRKDSFRVSIVLTMFWITVNCLIFYLPIGGVSKLVFFLAVNGALYFYLIINVIRTRRMLRKMYGIPTGARPMNDVLVGSIIPQLALMQMLRHTCDYDTYSGQCCTRVSGARQELHAVITHSKEFTLHAAAIYTAIIRLASHNMLRFSHQ